LIKLNGTIESTVKVLEERTETLTDRINRHEDKQDADLDDIWSAINSLRNRLPNWAVLVISLLTALCGWLAGKAL